MIKKPTFSISRKITLSQPRKSHFLYKKTKNFEQTLTNEKYKSLNENIMQKNKKLNNLIDNYNMFIEKFRGNNPNQMELINTVQREIKKLDGEISQTRKLERVAPTLLGSKESVKIENEKFTDKKKKTTSRKKYIRRVSKSRNVLKNFFNANNSKVLKHVLQHNMLEEENAMKNPKKKIEDFKKVERIVSKQNNFLMFLMNKNIEEENERQNHSDKYTVDKMNRIQSKIKCTNREKRIKTDAGQKINEIYCFLNKNLLKNYRALTEISGKNERRDRDTIMLPSPVGQRYNFNL